MRIWTVFCLLMTMGVTAQEKLSLVFMGDVMGHDGQIASAFVDSTGGYDYVSCFRYIKEDIESADIAIANLEVTLAGPPFKGYPQFSSPDTLADALISAGVDALVMANNHCVDRHRKGLERTIEVLDKRDIPRTGVFKDSIDRVMHNPLIIKKKGFVLGLLNYTYGTNGIRVTAPNIVNHIDTAQMAEDILLTKQMGVDQIIVFLHWGYEYQTSPNREQKRLTDFLWQQGVNIVIGSHPHVVQPMQWIKTRDQNKVVVYSLGNFISNQRTAPRDGGVMAFVELTKDENSTFISDVEYQLTWVYTPFENGKKCFYVLPARRYANKPYWPDQTAKQRMSSYVSEAQLVFENNLDVSERNFRKRLHKLDGRQLDVSHVECLHLKLNN